MVAQAEISLRQLSVPLAGVDYRCSGWKPGQVTDIKYLPMETFALLEHLSRGVRQAGVGPLGHRGPMNGTSQGFRQVGAASAPSGAGRT